MRPQSLLSLFCCLLFFPPMAHATATYDYGADEYVTIATGISPNGKYAITAHGETREGGELGRENFHICLTDNVTGKKIGPLEEVVDPLDTAAAAFCAQWSEDSHYVTIIYRISRHKPHQAVTYLIRQNRAVPLKGPIDATDDQSGYWTNQCLVWQPSERIFGTSKTKKTP